MATDRDLIWTLSTQGTLRQIREYLNEGRLVVDTPGVLSGKLLRTKDGLNVIHVLKATRSAAQLVEAVREHWAALRDSGLADSQPVKIFVTADVPDTVVYAFRWKNAESRSKAHMEPATAHAWTQVKEASLPLETLPAMNEVYQGFEYKRFPKHGGIELLRGKCTCVVEIDGLEGAIELDGQNGFVLMHRGPRYLLDNKPIMPITLVAHGADSPNPWAADPKFKDKPELANFLIRVEQNTELPQFGIIRAQSQESDFPATAMWVVHWRIHTPIGTIVTDPDVPLVFGPTTVHHYPPVGTEFQSSTGAVDVYNVDTEKVVGRLTPGELTAFDIVVTLDDEIPSVMDVPCLYHVEMFNKHIESDLRLSTDGLYDDYRIPRHLRSGPARKGAAKKAK